MKANRKDITIKTPIISVVMAVFNAEHYLKEAIESIIQQSLTNIEIIIIDDGSTDKSLSIIKNFSEIDPRIKYITRENRGLIYSLNEGINLSAGKYIARMDADDIALNDRLEVQYKFIVQNKLDICGGDYMTIDSKGSILKKYRVPKNKYDILLTMLSNVPFPGASALIRSKFLTNNNLKYGLDGHKNAEDLDLWLKMYDAGAKFGNVDHIILKYRVHSMSLSKTNHKAIKIEVNDQFDTFTKKHIESIESAFKKFCKNSYNSNNTEKITAKALIRYLSIKFDLDILLKCFIKMYKVNFLYGVTSFIKSKIFSL